MPKLAVFVSGMGSILEAIIEHPISVDLVIADRQCRGLEIARNTNFAEVALLERTDFTRSFNALRNEYTKKVIDVLVSNDIDIIAMAGYMTVLDSAIFEVFGGRILNTHPSLLPAFKGANAVKDALTHGVKWTGCTVHIATAKVDEGPILARMPVFVFDDDTIDTLHERIKTAERKLYPEVIAQFLSK